MMKRLNQVFALLLAVCLMSFVIPFAGAAACGQHFTDVPSDHWAFDAVEKAYADGAMNGIGGNAGSGSGIFAPNDGLTYASFVTMLTRAFYPEDIAAADAGESWYTPYLKAGMKHNILTTTSLNDALVQADRNISRFDMAEILIKILEDKKVPLPSEDELDKVNAKIGDWNEVSRDQNHAYYVSRAYATGLISGVDDKGSFMGNAVMVRASAAVIYTRIAELMRISERYYTPDFNLVFDTGWGAISQDYKDAAKDVFSSVYPRLWARWDGPFVPRTVYYRAEAGEEWADSAAAITVTSHVNNRLTDQHVSISYRSVENENQDYFAHELGHVSQSYPSSFKGSWWHENLAGYARFRYYIWAAEDTVRELNPIWDLDSAKVRDWGFEPYGQCELFFAYMDAKYPTTKQGDGLIDAIHHAIRNGTVTSDGGKEHNDPAFNAIVKRITGLENMEQLRRQYVRELDAGTWTFNGFGGYADNYITEGLPGVKDPEYPTLSGDICRYAKIAGVSGTAVENEYEEYLVDGDINTKWCEITPKDNFIYYTRKDENTVVERHLTIPGAEHCIAIDLRRPYAISSYKLHHAGTREIQDYNTVRWAIWYLDENGDLQMLDSCEGNTENITARSFERVTTQYIILGVLNSSSIGDHTVRLYELELK